MLYHDDLGIHHLDDWKFYTCNKRGRDADPPERQKHTLRSYEVRKAVGLVPNAARTEIECASCEVCSYHLGLD